MDQFANEIPPVTRDQAHMNYRHAFHAGNFADCMKHALLIEIMTALLRKPAAFCVLDTHAGIGRYDLRSEEAQRTGEWRGGIGALRAADPAQVAPLRPYLDMVARAGATDMYPGSPLLAAMMLREGDSLLCCELHPEDARLLRRNLRGLAQVHVHERDGYEALSGLLPPRNARRGLVLIDPPFEQPDEFERLAQGMIRARQRFPNGIVVGWYPVKHRAPVRAFHDALRDAGLADVIAAELTLLPPLDPTRFNGAGLVIAGAPFGFMERAQEILDCLARVLGGPDAQGQVTRVTEEIS